jgi:hypothetical protein
VAHGLLRSHDCERCTHECVRHNAMHLARLC